MLDSINAEGDIGARAALQKNGIQFDKPSGSEWREIAKQALENLEKVGAYPADTYRKMQAELETYRKANK